jgi:hypothetical protein
MTRIPRLFAIAATVIPAGWCHAVTLSNVRTEAAAATTTPVTIRFQLDARARVELSLYDGADGLVRRIKSAGVLQPGENALSWDLGGANGQPVPPDAYLYVLRAEGVDGSTTVYDLSEVDRDALVPADAVKWDKESRTLSYTLRKPARVKLRVGLQEPGPLLHTVVNMAPRAGGENSESWDGKDTSQLLDLGIHQDLAIAVTAYGLPPNALIVGRATALAASPPGDLNARRQSQSARPTTIVSPWDLADYTAKLSVVNAAEPAAIGKPVRLRVDVPTEFRSQILGTRLEPVFFVDGRFVFENETGFLPMTWEWTPGETETGDRIVSVNLRGYEGRFGIASIKVRLAPGTGTGTGAGSSTPATSP